MQTAVLAQSASQRAFNAIQSSDCEILDVRKRSRIAWKMLKAKAPCGSGVGEMAIVYGDGDVDRKRIVKVVEHLLKKKLRKQEDIIVLDDFNFFLQRYPYLCRKVDEGEKKAPLLAPRSKETLYGAHPNEILEGQLHLSDCHTAVNKQAIITDLDIGAVVNCTHWTPSAFEKLGVLYKRIIVVDDQRDRQALSEELPAVVGFIHENLKANKRVLVHCEAGVSRSATVVIAYVMTTTRASMKESLAYVKECRPDIEPNPGFIQILNDFENGMKQSATDPGINIDNGRAK